MEEQSSGSAEVLTAIHQINEISITVKDGSGLMMIGSEKLTSEMQKL